MRRRDVWLIRFHLAPFIAFFYFFQHFLDGKYFEAGSQRIIRRVVDNLAKDEVPRKNNDVINSVPDRQKVRGGGDVIVYRLYVYINVRTIHSAGIEERMKRMFVRYRPPRIDVGWDDRHGERL